MKYRPFRCRVCGEVYLGSEQPGECPFCGAHKQYLMDVNKEGFKWLHPESLTEKSKENVLAAIKLELDNAAFYACAAKKTESENDAKVFKRLGKIEAEHADALTKLGKVEEGEMPETTCSVNANDNYRESHAREDRAINAYKKFAEEAVEPEVKAFFQAIVEVEEDHLSLSEGK